MSNSLNNNAKYKNFRSLAWFIQLSATIVFEIWNLSLTFLLLEILGVQWLCGRVVDLGSEGYFLDGSERGMGSNRPLGKSCNKNYISYFSIKTYVAGTD